MAESLIALACVAGLGTLSLLAAWASPMDLAYVALICCAGGMLVGVPFGVVYHLVLRHELLRSGPLPSRWYLAPQRYHAELDPVARRRVLRWFYAGGAWFAVVVFGMMVAVLSLVIQLR
jgi:hypothetical protein